jgi:putative phosphoesterase
MVHLLVLSDTHDNMDAVNRLVRCSDYKQADMLIHLGDIVSPFTLKALLKSGKRLVGVFGNNDGDKVMLKELCPSLKDQPQHLRIEGINLTLLHGFGSPEVTEGIVDALLNHAPRGSLILYGHTHRYRVKVLEDKIAVNPGALSGYLSDFRSYALLTISTDAVYLEIKDLDSGRVIEQYTLKI